MNQATHRREGRGWARKRELSGRVKGKRTRERGKQTRERGKRTRERGERTRERRGRTRERREKTRIAGVVYERGHAEWKAQGRRDAFDAEAWMA